MHQEIVLPQNSVFDSHCRQSISATFIRLLIQNLKIIKITYGSCVNADANSNTHVISNGVLLSTVLATQAVKAALSVNRGPNNNFKALHASNFSINFHIFDVIRIIFRFYKAKNDDIANH